MQRILALAGATAVDQRRQVDPAGFGKRSGAGQGCDRSKLAKNLAHVRFPWFRFALISGP